MAAVTHDTLHAPSGFSAGFLKVEGVHRPLEADVQFVDGAFRDRVDGDAVEAQILVDGGDIGLRPRQHSTTMNAPPLAARSMARKPGRLAIEAREGGGLSVAFAAHLMTVMARRRHQRG